MLLRTMDPHFVGSLEAPITAVELGLNRYSSRGTALGMILPL
jgi:hypothetical protein